MSLVLASTKSPLIVKRASLSIASGVFALQRLPLFYKMKALSRYNIWRETCLVGGRRDSQSSRGNPHLKSSWASPRRRPSSPLCMEGSSVGSRVGGHLALRIDTEDRQALRRRCPRNCSRRASYMPWGRDSKLRVLDTDADAAKSTSMRNMRRTPAPSSAIGICSSWLWIPASCCSLSTKTGTP